MKYAGSNPRSKCGDYIELSKRVPIELRYSVNIVDGHILVSLPSGPYFEALFNQNTDGIAVDILRRNQYRCYEKNRFARSWANRGTLLRPMYKKEMLSNSYNYESGHLVIDYGKIPSKFDPNDIECNLIVLQKKYFCDYQYFSNFDFASWNILEMGLYKDSLSEEESEVKHHQISKTLSFTIPFKKNKTSFDESDIVPLYDSLNLTDYNIKEMTIRAYTSVEGSLEKNITLQEARARAIVSSLQSYQKPEIIFSVSANENWVEFLNDIENSRFDFLKTLSKEEIKIELQKKSLLDDIEPILKNHRKVLVTLRLQKRFTSDENDGRVLKKFFDQSIASGDIQEAIYLQQIIFEKIRDGKIPDEFIGQLEVPESSKYGPLLNNFAIFKYEQNDIFIYENITNFERLLTLLPDNPKIFYNLISLKIKAWQEGELVTNRNEIKKSIEQLAILGVDKSLIRRLRANYHIILTQYLNKEKDFKAKNKSLKEVYWLYSQLQLNDADLLSLSKYLSYHSKFDWAESVLSKRIKEVDVSEDLIFYFLNLTIGDPYKTKQSAYRTFMLNAIDKNNVRFCNLFLPKPQGGYTFQLLNDEFLRKTYCENCYSK